MRKTCDKLITLSFVICLALFFLLSCKTKVEKPEQPVSMDKETSIAVNRKMIRYYDDVIKAYVQRHNWDMEKAPAGFWYQLLRQGDGEQAREGMKAGINYTLSLLDGTVCYQSAKDELKWFKIGQGGVESGLEKGILYMNQGGKARFILPPYLAHGLVGDGDKIPRLAIVIYEVELVELN